MKLAVDVMPPLGNGRRAVRVEVIADSGAVLSVIPSRILRELKVPVKAKVRARLADGRVIVRNQGETRIRVQGRTLTTQAIFGAPRDPPLLGVIVLEALGLAVDPRKKRLVTGEILLLPARRGAEGGI